MPDTVFECPTPKCAYAIDAAGLNKIQLKALRMWAKTCPRCQKLGHFVEKLPLLNTKTINDLGGSEHANHSKANTKTASQRRKAAGYTGH